jgi:hypothetical protein
VHIFAKQLTTTPKIHKMKTTIEITRLDYNNPTQLGGYVKLETFNSIQLIEDANEVYSIDYYFQTEDEAKLFAAQFPKSYNAKINKICGYLIDTYFSVNFHFNTFWSTSTTGDKNESASLRRLKVIQKLKNL